MIDVKAQPNPMTAIDDNDLRAMIAAMAKALDLPVGSDNESVVKTHLAVAFRMAALLMDFPLSDEAEQAPVFNA